MIGFHSRILAALWVAVIAMAVASPPARAVEVDTVNGKKSADRLSFDGKKFMLFSETGNLTLDPAQVKFFAVDDARAATLQKQSEALTAQLEEQKKLVQALRGRLETTSATLVKREAEAVDLRTRVKQNLAEDPAPALRQQIETLKDENRQATVQVRDLQDQLDRLKRTPSAAAAAAPIPFVVACQPPSSAKAAGLVNVMGTVRNLRTQHYDKVILEVTALDADGKPLAVTTTFVSNLDAGATRAFATDIEVPDAAKVARAEAAVAEAD